MQTVIIRVCYISARVCRYSVTKNLQKQFHTPTDAAEFLKGPDSEVPWPSSPSTPPSHTCEQTETPHPETSSHSGCFEETIGQSTQAALTTEVENWYTLLSADPFSLLPPVPSTDDECCGPSTVEVEELATRVQH